MSLLWILKVEASVNCWNLCFEGTTFFMQWNMCLLETHILLYIYLKMCCPRLGSLSPMHQILYLILWTAPKSRTKNKESITPDWLCCSFCHLTNIRYVGRGFDVSVKWLIEFKPLQNGSNTQLTLLCSVQSPFEMGLLSQFRVLILPKPVIFCFY